MRNIFVTAIILSSVIGFNIGLLSCKPELNGLLAVDPNGNPSTYLVCRSSGLNSVGYWERKACPDNTVFDFVKQQCRQKNHQRPPMMNIAILNNSCANGEICIGGSVCDLERLRCLCPYGTVPKLETLSCIKPQLIKLPVNSSYELSKLKTTENFQSTPSSFLPNLSHLNAISNILKPQWFNLNSLDINNTVQNSLKTYKNGSSYDHNELHGHGIKSSTVELRNETHELSNMSGRIGTTSQPTFVFQPNVRTSTPYSEQTKTVTMLAGPGQSCQRHEVCTGGSVCTQPISLCLCPGELVEKNGECVLPSTAVVETVEVGIGEACSERTKCSYGSSCVMGRCACVAPLIEYNGLCIIYGAHKEVGPGEPCDGGVICTRGSVCDSAIPVCVCPKNTDLKDGVCVSLMTASKPYLTRPTKNQLQSTSDYYSGNSHKNTVHSTTSSPSLATSNTTEHLPFVPQRGQLLDKYNSSSMISEPDSRTHVSNYTILTSMPMKPFGTAKHIKVPSGSRQFGVGVTCSLNTDCMIGAYCNGNTNPPSCQCLSTHVDVEGRCEHVVYPGQNGCHSDYQCSAVYKGAKCVDRICVCPAGFKEHNGSCVSASEPATSPPGGSCTDNQLCTGGSVCRNGLCICSDPTMIAQRGICIQSAPRQTVPTVNPIIHPSFTQTYRPTTTYNHTFNHGQSRSPATYTDVIHAKYGRKISPGSNCGPLDSCEGNAFCVDGLCVCAAGMQPSSDGKCERIETSIPSVSSKSTLETGASVYARPGQKCSSGEICTGGSYCSKEGLCMCSPEKPYLHGGKCSVKQYSKTAKLGELCDENTTCTEGSTCDKDTGICKCPPDHITSGQQCQLPSTFSTVIKPLTTSLPLPHLKLPTIDATFIEATSSTSLTTRKLRYGEFCDSGKDKCTFGAECIDSVCKCGPGFALSTNGLCERFDFHLDGKSGTTILYISKNSTNTTISPSHTYLNSNTTKAKQSSFVTKPRQNGDFESHAPMQRKYTQVPTVSLQPKVVRHRFLGTKCRGSDVCINGGECQFGICQCPGGLFPRNGKCLRADQLPRVKPNDSCENGELCTGGSICDNDSKICICATGHLAIGDRCSRKDAPPFSGPGELCLKGEICSGGSFCLAGICQCDSEHYIDDGYCRHIASKSSPIQQLPDSALQFDRRMVKPRAPALLCNETTCRLPNCFCSISGRKPPGQLSPNNTPQFVVLTFDDAVNERTLPDYMEIFEKAKYRNPNGCPIKGTFFISHEWTDYDAVEWLFHQGMEIAANSMSHVSLERSSALRWLNEMEGQRRVMARFASVNEEDVIGMRAPQLALGGDEQFEMMAQASFVYDNSISVDPGVNGEPFWPQTMDHSAPWQCHNAQCPARSFPGIWEIPLNQFYGSYVPQIQNFRRSSMIRAAVDLNITVDQLTMLLLSNFERSYLRNRAPYILSLNADLLQLNGKNTGMEALQRFLEELQYKKDVYVVTLKQLLQWMRDPVPIDQISQADSLNCEQTITSKHPTINRRPCAKPNKCVYFTPGLSSREHWFRTCSPCPYQYPWINNTIGVATL